ncbi:TRAM domain-containing protein [Corynebacterium bovis]|uniref:class I SAM-dependent RNA methyltransferase n=1 Tax=Corynebacterium bovis TaxID=36808 RepID=UPI00244906CE|nr:TRAM domain-containing protein [Corynebacterium bovis]MDH2455084.1 TRAM domain-containing protein [Corynebacterium bovis]
MTPAGGGDRDRSTSGDGAGPSRETVVLDVGGPAHGGAVIGRLDGQVVFVDGALPDERGVTVELDPASSSRSRRRFRTGHAVAVAEPAPERVDPVCPAARAGAGCCDLDTVSPAGALALKRRVVVDQVRRIGHVDLTPDSAAGRLVTSAQPEPVTGYRTRVRLGVDDDGHLGARRRGGHDLVPVAGAPCAQWSPELVAAVAACDGAGADPGTDVCVAVGSDGRWAAVEIGGPRSRTRRRVLTGTDGDGDPDGLVRHVVDGRGWEIPAEAFWQAHRAAPELYTRWIRDHVPAGPGCGWDLYGGAGVFAATLAGLVDGGVDCVDVATGATAAGRGTLADLDVRFVDGAVDRRLDGLRSRGGLHVVCLDPPRTGAGAETVRRVAAAGPRHVVHIACDPATGARDLAAWREEGYDLRAMTVVDAFGLTHHVEVLMHLTPTSASAE